MDCSDGLRVNCRVSGGEQNAIILSKEPGRPGPGSDLGVRVEHAKGHALDHPLGFLLRRFAYSPEVGMLMLRLLDFTVSRCGYHGAVLDLS